MFKLSCFRRNLQVFLVAAALVPMVGRQLVNLFVQTNQFYWCSQGSIGHSSRRSLGSSLRGFNCLTQEIREKTPKLNPVFSKSSNFPEIVSFSRITANRFTTDLGKIDFSSAGPIPLRI
jgi:hypothetical protein